MKLGNGGATDEEMEDYFRRLMVDNLERYEIRKRDLDSWRMVGDVPDRNRGTLLYWVTTLLSLVLIFIFLPSEVWEIAIPFILLFVITLYMWFRHELRMDRIRFWTEPGLVKRYDVQYSESVVRLHQGLSFGKMDFVVFDASAKHDDHRFRGTIFQVLKDKVLITLWQQEDDVGHTTVHVCPATTHNADDVNQLRSIIEGHIPGP